MALIFAFGLPFLVRLGRLAKQHNSATIADLVVARLRADRGLGFTITLVALFGIIPYIALQLKAVSQGLGALLGDRFAPAGAHLDMSFWFALTMAAVPLLFGARKAAATEPNRGIVVALGLESLLKLAALLAIGLCRHRPSSRTTSPWSRWARSLPLPCPTSSMSGWWNCARART
ncbi:hypothetical protein G6F40_015549 [Rhizopus arrhizus]|nr:hypothetical protein G6F40_015549 [Rhizopus arrhizus]